MTTIKIPVITTALLKAQAEVRSFANFPSPRRDSGLQAVVDILATLDPPIQAALDAVNGKAASFTVTAPCFVRVFAARAEEQLEQAGVPKHLRVGAVVTATPAGPMAKAYGRAATSTLIRLERRPRDEWVLTGVTRCQVYPCQPKRSAIEISDRAAEAVQRAALAPFTVRPGSSSAPAVTAGIEERLGVAA